MTIDDLEFKYREEYTKGMLSETDLHLDPFAQFEAWFKAIAKVKTHAPNAMHLSTVSSLGRPSARIVLLKHFDDKGLVFFTNYSSRKAQEIEGNPNICVTFFCDELEREIRVEGQAVRVSEQDSMDYAKSRPFESQVAAYISKQSQPLDSRKTMTESYDTALKLFENKEVPLDNSWGGYRLVPEYFEFWQGREHRLHDRLIYTLEEDKWAISRLYP